MGRRGQVYFEDTGLYLYTHWGALYIKKAVKKALTKEVYWNCPEKLMTEVKQCMEDVEKDDVTIETNEVYMLDVFIVINCTIQVITIYERDVLKQIGSFKWFITNSSKKTERKQLWKF